MTNDLQEPVSRTVAIISIGEMGLGIARMLQSYGFRIITNTTGRSSTALTLRSSASTLQRAEQANIETVNSDEDLVSQSDAILSILPPRDAVSLAQRISQAVSSSSPSLPRRVEEVLYYVDLNAISPATVSRIAGIFAYQTSRVRYVDGGIIGGPPQPDTSFLSSVSTNHNSTPATPFHPQEGSISSGLRWKRPSIPVSGPFELPVSLASALNTRHISKELGPASGLKMCFASLTKGFTALAIQSFTSAESLGVLDELKAEMATHAPLLGTRAEKGIVSCMPKAYRWVREMEEIADTFSAVGFGSMEKDGDEFSSAKGGDLFRSVAEVYRFLAEDVVPSIGTSLQDGKGIAADDLARNCAQVLKNGT